VPYATLLTRVTGVQIALGGLMVALGGAALALVWAFVNNASLTITGPLL